MPQGDKSAYTSKQKRQARDIEKGYERRGVSEKESARRAWATVNKQTGGGLKRKTAKTAGKKAGAKKTATKKTATKKTATKKAAGKRVTKQATKKAARRSAR
jgi:hypothetical protein